MSLYDVLGVSPDADAATIRAAHRRLVKTSHPDAGGDRGVFERVQHAYLILRDPKTRERYDATGEEEAAPDNELAEIATIIVGCFDQATAMCGGRFDRIDLIAEMRKGLAARLANAREGLANLKAGVDAIERITKRLSYKGDRQDVIGSMLSSRLAENRRAQAAVGEEIANIERAQAYAADYGYAFDPAPPAASGLAGLYGNPGRDDGWVRNYFDR